ncbi:MAG: transcriptional regulator CadC [Rhodospirillales bacterium]|jgi:DNA-binding response OmpR family regulator|nr:transcriptional regulator CadC [Rhodospirillales bacterium]
MDEIAETNVLHFAGVMLDSVRGCLRGADGAEVPLAPKPFDLLMVLTCNPGRTMSKDALLAAIWPGVHVAEDSLFQAVREAPRDRRRGRACDEFAPVGAMLSYKPVLGCYPLHCPGPSYATPGHLARRLY